MDVAGRLNEEVLIEKESLQDFRRIVFENKINNWKDKPLHGEFAEQTSDKVSAESWDGYEMGF